MGIGTPTKVSMSRDEAIKAIQQNISSISNELMEDILNLLGDRDYRYRVGDTHDEFCIKADQFK